MIPFSPPRIDDRTVQAVTEALRSGWITTGPRTKEFEKRLATYCGVQRVIALNSWTNACELVLRWYGVGPGDEVIVEVEGVGRLVNHIISQQAYEEKLS